VKVLVTGAGGQLGRDLVAAFSGVVPPGGRRTSLRSPEGQAGPAHDVVAAGHAELPVDRRELVLEAVDALAPDVVVHAAAMTAVDRCEEAPERAWAVNALGTRNVAEAARRAGAHLVYLSTDYVFDGDAGRPYVEWDEPRPRSVYGRSKRAGELECPDGATIVRTSWLSGAGGDNVVATALRLAAGPGELRFVDDQRASPTFAADLAAAVVTLALEQRPGVFHVTNQGVTSWFGLVREVLARCGHDPGRVHPIATADLDPPRAAPRPAYSALDNCALALSDLPLLPSWQDGLGRLLGALNATERAA